MNPFFFGTSQRQLFGIHHPPEGVELRDGAVLISPPLGHEYIAAHRPLQQLAVRLARQGLHVLRFDFFGCGDSAGDLEEATVAQWRDDVQTALQELRDMSGSRRLSIVGLRLGATVAAASAAAATGSDLRSLVLWEPVVNGADYVTEMFGEQRDWERRTFPKPRPETLHWPVPEVLGFPITEDLQRDLGALDLLNLPGRLADRALVVQNEEESDYASLRTSLTSQAGEVELSMVEHEACWRGHRGGTIALVPVPVNQAISDWIAEGYR
ncbi:MAG: alpha/beta fold hydrolase [Planctomycetota bacterium]